MGGRENGFTILLIALALLLQAGKDLSWKRGLEYTYPMENI